MADRYASMNTAALELEAADRGVSLEGATTNAERAQRLRDADAGQVAQGPDVQDPAPDIDHPLGEAHAGYPSEQDVTNRVNAATGSDEHFERQDPPAPR